MQSDDVAAIRERIADIKARRGYALPSHAVLAATAPTLLAAYEDVYRAITYDFVALTPFEKAFVWLVVVVCGESPTSKHHLQDFLVAGGTPAQVSAAAHLGMLGVGVRTLDTVAPGWQNVMPAFDGDKAYIDTVEGIANAAALPVSLVDAALAAGCACRRDWKRVEMHIRRAKLANLSDDALAEALTVCILPSGNPGFVQACGVWRKLVDDGSIPASAAFRAAAEVS